MEDRSPRTLVARNRDRIVAFCRRLLQTPSLSGQEQAVADLVLAEMRALGYSRIDVDGVGNVIATIPGRSQGRSVLLHAHMDIVDPGDPARWHHGPYSGDLVDGRLWGRGAVDTKSSLAAQIYAAGLLQQAGLESAGDLLVAAVVGEETGGFGTTHLVKTLRPGIAVIGEPSGNTLRRAHRGRFEFVVTFHGRSAHASAPDLGRNPHYAAARFLLALREAPLAKDPTFGGSSVSPTLSYVDQTSSNVIPAEVSVHLDWRNAPQETSAEAAALLRRLLAETAEEGIEARVAIRRRGVTSYTGVPLEVAFDMNGFILDEDDPNLLAARSALEGALGRPVVVDVWHFTTDGGQLSARGVPCIGFGPGDDALAHVADESVTVDELLEATAGYMALALNLGKMTRS
ncbi:MAG: M20 family metallopeptidase [Anaerolineae bacterium]